MHFTDSREGKTFRDHQVSFTSEEIRCLIEKIGKIRMLQGDSDKSATRSEIEAGHVEAFRRAVYPLRDLSAGTVLTENLITVLRPNHGIDARQYDRVLGKRINRDVKAYQKLDWQDLDD